VFCGDTQYLLLDMITPHAWYKMSGIYIVLLSCLFKWISLYFSTEILRISKVVHIMLNGRRAWHCMKSFPVKGLKKK
jgi:membrane glycosyltransferase